MGSRRIRQLLLLFSLFFHDSTLGSLQPPSPGRVLVLDIDGTVYDDECQIEQQIRDNCHIFASTFGYSASQSEELHNLYGSVIRGICEYGQPRIKFLDYYNDVYPHLDMSLLRKYSSVSSEGNTGYNIAMGGALNSLHRLDCPIVVASNSPVFHVKRVLTRLGLSQLKVAAFITPERRSGFTKNEPEFWDPLFELYPQDRFLCTLIDDNGLNVDLVRELGMRALRITSKLSLPEALVHFMNLLPPHSSEIGSAVIPGSKRSHDDFEFNEMSYLEAKNEIDVKSYNSDVQATLLNQLEKRILHRFKQSSNTKRTPLVAVDLGAGLLNMLPTVQKMFSDAAAISQLGDLELQYIAFESNKNIRKRTMEILADSGFVSIPSSVDLTAATASTIRSDVQSFKGTMTAKGDKALPMTVTVHLVSEDFMTDAAANILKDLLESHRCEGSLSTAAFSSMYTRARPSVDMFIGCCVADLIPPTELVAQVVEMAGDNGGLLYLPITFCGETRLIRGKQSKSQDPRPTPELSNGGLPVPSDSEVFDVYHRHLESRGHYIGVDRLISTLGNYGCTVVTPADRSASSDWKISKKNSPYMWKCMMRFVALGTAFETLGKFDLKTWFDGLTDDKPEEEEGEGEEADMMIAVGNIDILAVLPEIVQRILSPTEMQDMVPSADSIYCTDFSSPPAEDLRSTPQITRPSQHQPLHPAFSAKKQQLAPPSIRRSVEFLSPGNVHIVEEAVPKVGSNQLLIRTSCSLISTGTELKVFKGDLDPDEPTDLTIDSLKEKMTYPLRYGYSLVGEVVAVGDGVVEADWLGKLVFSFSPHSSAVVIDVSSAMLVPEGIAPEDAVFLPSVETAVSFVQAARPNIGERVLVVGQGLIGMLTGAVMTQLSNADTTIADVSEKRLAAASSFNSKATPWNPTAPRSGVPAFDLTVEVSGHPGGLQTAIDSTGSNGRIVIGSWYGEKPTQVKLGLRFHRSGIQLQTSQVSSIPPELTGRWDKKRRFDLTWDTIRLIKPSRLISSVSPLRSEDVLAAYIRLEKGEDVTVLFRDDL